LVITGKWLVSSTKTRWKFGPMFLILLVTACQAVTSLVPRQLEVSMEIYSLPDGSYPPDMAWLNEGIVMEYQPEAHGPINSALWWVKVVGDQANLQKIELPVQHDCAHQVFRSPMWLPDGRLGYAEVCIRDVEPGDQTYVMAYDLETKQVEQLFNYGLRGLSLGGRGHFVWSADMSRAIASDGHGIYLSERLAWFTPRDWQNVDLPFGISYAPAWSPDGQQIAFVATGEKATPFTLSSKRYSTYLMPVDRPDQFSLLKANLEAGALAWSPVDNDWIAYNDWGTGRDGLWLLQVGTGKQYKLASGFIGAFTWSPDGRQIAALRDPETEGAEGPAGEYKLIIIEELDKLLQELSAEN
jgi:hypothetical protein